MVLNAKFLCAQEAATGSNKAKPRTVLLHGFSQNLHCWGDFGEILCQSFEVLSVDAPGHGLSHHDLVSCDEAGALLTEVGQQAFYIGYSMGGRIALHAALNDDVAAVKGLVLIGATAGISHAAERADRQQKDKLLAKKLEKEGLISFLDCWLQQPLFRHLSDKDKMIEQRLRNRIEGLAGSLRHRGTGAQHSLWERLPDLKIPVLLIAGERDYKFVEHNRQLATEIPSARLEIIEGVGHAAHLEKPEQVAEIVEDFCSTLGIGDNT